MTIKGDENGIPSLEKVKDSFRYLLTDGEIPSEVRKELGRDFDELKSVLDKLENRELHIAALGRVGVGKSAVLNALAGKPVFEVGVLFGVTQDWQSISWENDAPPDVIAGASVDQNLVLIDTPGFSEAGQEGMDREAISKAVADRADLILFVCDGDLTAPEQDLVRELSELRKPLLVVLNKTDRFRKDELEQILETLANKRLNDLVDYKNIVTASADPRPVSVKKEDGQIEQVGQAVDVEQIRERILALLEREGLDILAVNSALFASRLSDRVSTRVAEIRASLSERTILMFSAGKAVAVALNPIPVADILTGVATDAAMIVTLARLHGMPVSWRTAEELAATVGKQMVLLVGTEVLTHTVATILKGVTFGLATILTAVPQGLVAGYNSMIIGRATQVYLQQGFSWGPKGPKAVVRNILDQVDERTYVAEMRSYIFDRIKKR